MLDLAAGRLVARDPALEDVQVRHPDARQLLLCLRGADTGLADQQHLAVQPGSQLLGVLAEQVQRHVVGAGDVLGLELRRVAHVDDRERVGVAGPAHGRAWVDAVGQGGRAHSLSSSPAAEALS